MYIGFYFYTFDVFLIHSQVPLNYSDPSVGNAVLAVIKSPAQVSSDDPTYRGPVFYNPGGSGVSGVDAFTDGDAATLSALFGPTFDVISFDPRGMLLTNLCCSLTDAVCRCCSFHSAHQVLQDGSGESTVELEQPGFDYPERNYDSEWPVAVMGTEPASWYSRTRA